MTANTATLRSTHVKPRRRGLQALLTHGTFRRVVQLAFAGFILYTIAIHVISGESATTASAEAFCPFGGLETLYKYITGGGGFVSHTHLSNLVLAVAVLATALLLRSAFCGWICPLGFIQDMLHSLSAWAQKRSVPLRKAMRAISQTGRPAWSFLDKYLRFIKYGVLVWAVSGAAVYGVMVFRDYDPWSALINIAEWSFTPGVVVLSLTLVGSLFVERPWCRYGCPLGAASGLLGKLSPVYIKREAKACTVCKICTRACPMGLPVHSADKITSVDCIGCLECVEACPRQGAMEVRVGLPLLSKQESHMKINPFVYGMIVLAMFMGIIWGAQGLGLWTASGKVDAAGQGVQPSAANVDSVKGWMTLEQVSTTFTVPVAEIVAAFELPPDTPASTALKDLESDTFDIPALREWLSARSATP